MTTRQIERLLDEKPFSDVNSYRVRKIYKNSPFLKFNSKSHTKLIFRHKNRFFFILHVKNDKIIFALNYALYRKWVQNRVFCVIISKFKVLQVFGSFLLQMLS